MKKKGNDNDSLEMLLDTICNIFGGIILMTLLIVLQTQTAANQLQNRQKRLDADSVRSQQLQAEYIRLQQLIDDVRQRQQDLQNQYQDRLTPEIVASIEKNTQYEQALILAQAKQEAINQLIDEAIADQSRQEQTRTELTAQIGPLKAETELLARQLNKNAEMPQNMRLPYTHYQEFSNFYDCVIMGNVVYSLNDPIMKVGAAPRTCGHCRISSQSGESGIKVEPIKGQGYALQNGQPGQDFFDAIKPFNALNIFVCGDDQSFKTFQIIKNAVLNRNYSYRTAYYSPQAGLVVYPAYSLPVQ